MLFVYVSYIACTYILAMAFPYFGALLGFFGGFAFAPTTYFVSIQNLCTNHELYNEIATILCLVKCVVVDALHHFSFGLQTKNVQPILAHQLGKLNLGCYLIYFFCLLRIRKVMARLMSQYYG